MQRTEPPHLPTHPPPPTPSDPSPSLPRTHLQQRIRASGKNQQSSLDADPLFCEAAQLLTVFFALPCKCGGIKAGVMGRRLCGGLFPKPTVAPYNGQGFPWSSSFFCGRRQKIMTESIFCHLAAPSASRLLSVATLRLATPALPHVGFSHRLVWVFVLFFWYFSMPNHHHRAGNVLRIYLPSYLYSLLSLGLLCLGVCRSSQNFLFSSGLCTVWVFFLGCLFAVVFLRGVND